MKKILALLCGLAFASGAWAYTYEFTITVTCPQSFDRMSGAGAYYLLNTSDHKAYVVWYGNDWSEISAGSQTLGLAKDKSQSAGVPIEYEGQQYYTIDANFEAERSFVHNESADEATGTKVVTFSHVFTTETQMDYKDFGADSQYGGLAKNLMVVITDPVLGIDTVFEEVGYTGSVGGAAIHFTTGGYMTVPEPTSGVLLLLGVAGLALRRRKVA